MFEESICPFARPENVEIFKVGDGFSVEGLQDELVGYYELISSGVQGKLAKCFLLPDYDNFQGLEEGVSVFQEVFSSFGVSKHTGLLDIPTAGVYHWFLVSNLYPEKYFRYMPKNMVLLTSSQFFPQADQEDVFYFTLNESVKKSLGEDPFPADWKSTHRYLNSIHPVIVQNYRRLVLTGFHDECEADYFNKLCEELNILLPG